MPRPSEYQRLAMKWILIRNKLRALAPAMGREWTILVMAVGKHYKVRPDKLRLTVTSVQAERARNMLCLIGLREGFTAGEIGRYLGRAPRSIYRYAERAWLERNPQDITKISTMLGGVNYGADDRDDQGLDRKGVNR